MHMRSERRFRNRREALQEVPGIPRGATSSETRASKATRPFAAAASFAHKIKKKKKLRDLDAALQTSLYVSKRKARAPFPTSSRPRVPAHSRRASSDHAEGRSGISSCLAAKSLVTSAIASDSRRAITQQQRTHTRARAHAEYRAISRFSIAINDGRPIDHAARRGIARSVH